MKNTFYAGQIFVVSTVFCLVFTGIAAGASPVLPGRVNGPPPPPPPGFTLSVSESCGAATALVLPAPTLSPLVFSYTWFDTLNNIISQTANSTDTFNTLNNLASGATYIVLVQWNGNGDTAIVADTITIQCGFTFSADTTICSGQSVKLWANATATGTYSWLPGGEDTSIITVTPDTTTTYTVTFMPDSGAPVNGAITVTVKESVSLTIKNAAICNGDTATLIVVPSVPGGTYRWSNGDSTRSITVSPDSTTNYTVSYTCNCGVLTDTGTVTVAYPGSPPELTSSRDSICTTGTADICASAGYTSYHWNTGATASCIVANSAGTYNVTVTEIGTCTVAGNPVTVYSYPTSYISVTDTLDTLFAARGFTNYQWYFDSNWIPAADSNVYIASQSGDYSVDGTDGNGCPATSTPVSINLTGINEVISHDWLRVFPNPTAGNWELTARLPDGQVGSEGVLTDDNLIGAQVEIIDDDGRVVYNSEIKTIHSEIEAPFARGVYLLRIISGTGVVAKKIVKL